MNYIKASEHFINPVTGSEWYEINIQISVPKDVTMEEYLFLQQALEEAYIKVKSNNL